MSQPAKARLLGEDLRALSRRRRAGSGSWSIYIARIAARRWNSAAWKINGIRCCYHGWLYDIHGNVSSNPRNPPTALSKIASNIRRTKLRRSPGLFSLISARNRRRCCRAMICFFEENGERHVGAGTEYCNWLQRAENSVDQTHLVALHAPEYPHMALKRPDIGWEQTAYGAKITMHVPGVSKPKHSHWVFPSHTRHTTARGWAHSRPRDSLPRADRRYQNDDLLVALLRRTTKPNATNRSFLRPSVLKTTSREFIPASRTAGGASPRTIKTASPRKAKVDIRPQQRASRRLG